jgi:hypothetical protein
MRKMRKRGLNGISEDWRKGDRERKRRWMRMGGPADSHLPRMTETMDGSKKAVDSEAA